MKTITASEPQESKAINNRIPFKILLAYDTLGNGKRGKECCDRLLRDFKNKYSRVDAYISVLKLGLIYDPMLLRKWHTSALEADLVLLSVQHETPLPDFVKRWISRWMNERHEKPAVLAALLNRQRADFIPVSPVQRYLQGLVRNENIALFTMFHECGEDCWRNLIRHRTNYISHTLMDTMKKSHPCFP
jgi:hypothetical protein